MRHERLVRQLYCRANAAIDLSLVAEYFRLEAPALLRQQKGLHQ